MVSSRIGDLKSWKVLAVSGIIMILSFFGFGFTYENTKTELLSDIFLFTFLQAGITAGVSAVVFVGQLALRLMRRDSLSHASPERDIEQPTTESPTLAKRIGILPPPQPLPARPPCLR